MLSEDRAALKRLGWNPLPYRPALVQQFRQLPTISDAYGVVNLSTWVEVAFGQSTSLKSGLAWLQYRFAFRADRSTCISPGFALRGTEGAYAILLDRSTRPIASCTQDDR